MKIDRFEKTLWSIALALLFLLVWAQIDMKLEYDEIRLKRQLAYKEFLDGGKRPGEWAVAYQPSSLPNKTVQSSRFKVQH